MTHDLQTLATGQPPQSTMQPPSSVVLREAVERAAIEEVPEAARALRQFMTDAVERTAREMERVADELCRRAHELRQDNLSTCQTLEDHVVRMKQLTDLTEAVRANYGV